MSQWSSIHITFSCHPSLNICKPWLGQNQYWSLLHISSVECHWQSSFPTKPQLYRIVFFLLSSVGPGVAGYLTAGTGTTVIPSVPPPVDNDSGDQGWRIRSCKHITQAHRLPCSPTAKSQRDPFSSQSRGRERERKSRLSSTKICLTSLPVLLFTPLTNTWVFINALKLFILTDFFFCATLCSFQWHRKVNFCMNIFFTLDFLFIRNTSEGFGDDLVYSVFCVVLCLFFKS